LRGGDISGTQATIERSGYIQANRIASVAIGGSIIAGEDTSTPGNLERNASIRASQDIGAISVRGNLVGNFGGGLIDDQTDVVISARGQSALSPTAAGDIAIKSIAIGGRVEVTKILAGYDDSLTPANGNASIGPVTVGRDWVTSDLVAGVQDDADLPIDDYFGDGDDQVIAGAGSDQLFARIASIAIKGVVVGAPNPFYQNGFVAQQIGAFKSAGYVAPLTSGVDGPFLVTAYTVNVNVSEV
jgi:hypothetical protein